MEQTREPWRDAEAPTPEVWPDVAYTLAPSERNSLVAAAHLRIARLEEELGQVNRERADLYRSHATLCEALERELRARLAVEAQLKARTT